MYVSVSSLILGASWLTFIKLSSNIAMVPVSTLSFAAIFSLIPPRWRVVFPLCH